MADGSVLDHSIYFFDFLKWLFNILIYLIYLSLLLWLLNSLWSKNSSTVFVNKNLKDSFLFACDFAWYPHGAWGASRRMCISQSAAWAGLGGLDSAVLRWKTRDHIHTAYIHVAVYWEFFCLLPWKGLTILYVWYSEQLHCSWECRRHNNGECPATHGHPPTFKQPQASIAIYFPSILIENEKWKVITWEQIISSPDR